MSLKLWNSSYHIPFFFFNCVVSDPCTSALKGAKYFKPFVPTISVVKSCLLGNVWEWVDDWWTTEHSTKHRVNPRGPKAGQEKVKKGKQCFYLEILNLINYSSISFIRCALLKAILGSPPFNWNFCLELLPVCYFHTYTSDMAKLGLINYVFQVVRSCVTRSTAIDTAVLLEPKQALIPQGLT